jgi:MinD-like ATPase involved in chromosome partitioning or flagellar assembly
MTIRQPDWDDNELVLPEDFRPSREAFGPMSSNSGQRPQRNQPPRNGNQRPQRNQPRGQQASAQGQGVRRQAGAPSPRQRQQAPQQQAPQGQQQQSPQQQGQPRQRPAGPPRQQRQQSQEGARRQQPARNGGPRRQRAGGGGRMQQSEGRGRSQRTIDLRDNAPRRRNPRYDDYNDEFANDLAASDRSTPAPSGWRGLVEKATKGTISLGPSLQERRDNDIRMAVRQPVTDGTVAVFSRKGGVGKTTISAYLGLTLAQERGGRIVALDGDAEAGSLGWLLAPRSPSTLAALASADPIPSEYADIRQYTTSTPEGLEVIVGDPAEMGPISITGLEAVAAQLARNYDVSIFDTGAGVTRATGRVLVNTARVLLLVMGPSIDSVRAAERTLAWLDERPADTANPDVQVIAVINGIPENAKNLHVERIESHFADRCSAVVRIPWDAHLAAGSSTVSLGHLSKVTQRAFLELAATTVGTLSNANAYAESPLAGAW